MYKLSAKLQKMINDIKDLETNLEISEKYLEYLNNHGSVYISDFGFNHESQFGSAKNALMHMHFAHFQVDAKKTLIEFYTKKIKEFKTELTIHKLSLSKFENQQE